MESQKRVRKYVTGTILTLLSILGYGWMVFAAAPSGGYTPGQTLNPDCAPADLADPDCVVQTGWNLNVIDDYVYNLSDKIGIGTITPDYGLEVFKDTFQIATTGFSRNQVSGIYGADEDGGTALFSFDLSPYVTPLGDNGEAIYMVKTTGPTDAQRAVLLMYDDGVRGAEANLFVRDGSAQPGFAAHPNSADFYYYQYNIGGSGTEADVVATYMQEDSIRTFYSFDRVNSTTWNEHNILINEADGFRFRFNVPKVAGVDSAAESQFQVDTDMTFSNPTATGNVVSFTNADGTCTLDPGSVAGFSCPSDRRLKKDITDLGFTLPNILKLRPVTYRLKNESADTPLTTGLIAQEVMKIFPKLVSLNENGMLGMNYAGLIPDIIKAIQELAQEVSDLRQRVTTEELCIGTTCITEQDLKDFKHWQQVQQEEA